MQEQVINTFESKPEDKSRITEAIILAGGLGTRLRPVVADLPKCLAPVAGNPFLHYVIQYLLQQGVNRFIFSLGYLSEAIILFLEKNYSNLSYQISKEDQPLGTGGAIQLAITKATQENILVLNGDTLFAADISELMNLHLQKNSACTLGLKPMQQFDRYGAVELNQENQIVSFHEKRFYNTGLINGGVYVLNRPAFLSNHLPAIFSFEKDFLEKKVGEGNFYGLVQDRYFIDIGIPEDLARAQTEIQSAIT